MATKMSSRKAFIFGGRRGLSLSLTNELVDLDYNVTVFTREQRQGIGRAQSYKYIDIDNLATIDTALYDIPQIVRSQSFDEVCVYLLYGGGLGINSGREEITYQTYARIFNHNLFMHHKVTSYFLDSIQPLALNTRLKFIYIFSAVSRHYCAEPLYVASKLALEGMMKAFVCMRKPNTSFCGFRLGIVDVVYKYYHKLSSENPVAFKQLVSDNLPSKYFPSTDEIAKFMVEATTNISLTNGMICDISGGNSWLIK